MSTIKKLSVHQIIENIRNGQCFEAEAEDHSFRIKIEHYVPYLCAAIHDGHQFRRELTKRTLLSEYDRWYEEDPHTADFISSFPIVIYGQDSRFEYDLNREPDICVYKEAWGKQVWKKALPNKEEEISKKKHQNFYEVIDALVEKLEDDFNDVLVYDIHSYNYVRHEREVPLFNIGTERVDQKRFSKVIEHWKRQLSKIDLGGDIKNITAINDVFMGRGYFLKHITDKFDNTLVLATEVKKVYCNELTGESHHTVIEGIEGGMKDAIIENVRLFTREFTNMESTKKKNLLSSGKMDETILTVDRELFKLVHNFELLNFVNPTNLAQEKKKFFKSGFQHNPEFTYRPIVINPWKLKRKLSDLPAERIKDVNIRKLYEDVIYSYFDKIDMLNTLGTPKFLYNSLRYFGEPDQDDINNAYFLMYCKEASEHKNEVPTYTSEDTAKYISDHVKENYDFGCKIEIQQKITSKALVLNSKQMVVIKKGEMFTDTEVKALANHEVGVHMVTTMNSINSKLKIFNMGLPKNTLTQEGLAVLSEYLSGNLNIERLKELALRVLCIKYLIKGYDFSTAFNRLVNKFNLDPDFAWYVTARVYRGGGFTKDYLYLQGFKEILKLHKTEPNFHNLLIGKTSFEYIETINEMVDRKFVEAPRNITVPYLKPQPSDDVLNYLISCIR